MMYVKAVVFKHCEKVIQMDGEGGCHFHQIDFSPSCSPPPAPDPATPWTLKTGGLKYDGGDILSSCQGYKIVSC